jgi:hypothetical protein
MILNKTMNNKFNHNNKKRKVRTLKNQLNKFVDFSKNKGIFYDNLYLNDVKFVIKMPIPDLKKEILIDNIRIEEFNLANSIFIFNYD